MSATSEAYHVYNRHHNIVPYFNNVYSAADLRMTLSERLNAISMAICFTYSAPIKRRRLKTLPAILRGRARRI